MEILKDSLLKEIKYLLKKRDETINNNKDPLALPSQLLLFDAILETSIQAGFGEDKLKLALALESIRNFNAET